jgi:hypothetical protein
VQACPSVGSALIQRHADERLHSGEMDRPFVNRVALIDGRDGVAPLACDLARRRRGGGSPFGRCVHLLVILHVTETFQ